MVDKPGRPVCLGLGSKGACFVDTMLTAAGRFLVLKTLLPFRLLLRIGGRGLGPGSLTVVMIRVMRPEGSGLLALNAVLVLVLLPAVSDACAVTGILTAVFRSKTGEVACFNKLPRAVKTRAGGVWQRQ